MYTLKSHKLNCELNCCIEIACCDIINDCKMKACENELGNRIVNCVSILLNDNKDKIHQTKSVINVI